MLWERPVDPEINLQEKMRDWKNSITAPYVSHADYAISADGSTAALAPRRPECYGQSRLFYLEIVDGRNGHPLVRWPVDYKDGLSLSPDGKLLAVAEAIQSKSGGFDAIARIYEVPSGKQVATVVHDSARSLFNAKLTRGIHFTPDGRYFVTSGNNNVKIWSVEQE